MPVSIGDDNNYDGYPPSNWKDWNFASEQHYRDTYQYNHIPLCTLDSNPSIYSITLISYIKVTTSVDKESNLLIIVNVSE